MCVHLVSHIICDMLSYPCVHIALENSYKIGSKSHTQRENNEQNEFFKAASYKSLVDYLTCQNRRQQVKSR